jgi:hypothetical protein
MQLKGVCSEYGALRQYFDMDYVAQSAGAASKGEGEGEAWAFGKGSASVVIARLGGCVVLAFLLYLLRRYLRRTEESRTSPP